MLESFFSRDMYRESAVFLSLPHLVALTLFTISIIWLYFHRKKEYMKHVRWIILVILILSEVFLFYWSFSYSSWTTRHNLPLNLCSISLYLCIFMLIFKSKKIFEVLYFFGIGGAIQALITPDLFYTFPHFRFLHFFIAHVAIILSILYMVWIYRFAVTLHSLFKSFIVLNVIAIFVFIVNVRTGANYMFLAEKPAGPSVLDYLGPYPWYILSLEILALMIFFLLYIPFIPYWKTKKKKYV
ncbi:conserved hypothetical protein [Evansella cellulosilytica DSM 2522]|uniref:TIGR02206 family membrane protein n=2 Tax=Evansella TaxID=2837485 RepID=E6U0W8_EVAC2|nr:conserved hypothetical protein [Evansella cellulosilytica DSM 2522]